MELYAQILRYLTANAEIQVTFPGLDINALAASVCYRALAEIKSVIDDPSLEDADCFERIERIIAVFEKYGSDCGGRHDF